MPTPPGHAPPEPDPRVVLAAERTLLAWVRTGLALMGFGFVLARFGLFLHEMAAFGGAADAVTRSGLSQTTGIVLVALGMAVNIAAATWHVRYVARYLQGKPMVHRPVSMGVLLAAAMTLVGVTLVYYLLNLG
jgi:putative membrane protein